MSDGEEWGPWIEHDGRPESVHGVYPGVRVQVVSKSGASLIGVVAKSANRNDISGDAKWLSWSWRSTWGFPFRRFVTLDGGRDPIIRYRIRKPRGLTILENLIADLPATVAPKVTA